MWNVKLFCRRDDQFTACLKYLFSFCCCFVTLSAHLKTIFYGNRSCFLRKLVLEQSRNHNFRWKKCGTKKVFLSSWSSPITMRLSIYSYTFNFGTFKNYTFKSVIFRYSQKSLLTYLDHFDTFKNDTLENDTFESVWVDRHPQYANALCRNFMPFSSESWALLLSWLNNLCLLSPMRTPHMA